MPYVLEVVDGLVLADWAVDNIVTEQGGRQKDCLLLFFLTVSVFRQSVEEETPCRSGPSKPEPTHTRPKQRSSELWPLPETPQQVPESLLGAGDVLSCLPWGHLPLMMPW